MQILAAPAFFVINARIFFQTNDGIACRYVVQRVVSEVTYATVLRGALGPRPLSGIQTPPPLAVPPDEVRVTV